MIQSVQSVWRSLWKSHHQTKRLLKFSQVDKAGEIAGSTDRKDGSAAPAGTGGPDGNNPKPAYSRAQLVGLILGPLLFLMAIFFFNPAGLAYEGRAVLAVTLWVATWWITEAIPIPATSLLPIILLPIIGAMDNDTVVSAYGNDIIFLFLGGFFIATAMEKWNLHKRIALFIINLIGVSTNRIILGFMLATGFLSMWVSNTAAVMMMVPIGLAIVYQVTEALKHEEGHDNDLKKFEKAIIFGIGYAGTIGGLGTLIGTPPNSILAGTVNELYGVQISFAGFMAFAAPLAVIMMFGTWVYLTKVVYKIQLKQLPGGRDLVHSEIKKLGKTAYEEKAVLAVFIFAAFMWITRSFLWDGLLPELTDGMVAMTATVLLFTIPASKKYESRILEWKDSKEIPWGILLLFGGGLALAAGFSGTGLSEWIGDQLTVLEGANLLLIIFVSATLVLFLTEITSNTATATMILPVVAALSVALGVHPYALMVPCALAANCAFMLPVGTPPNAIIFGTGKLTILEMVKNGFWINIVAVIIITLAVMFLLPLMWGIDLSTIPSEFQ